MKKAGIVFALALVLGTVAVTSCSSKETKAEEPVISGSTGTPSEPVTESSTTTANLGSSSSGQGR